ncbi:MAG: pyrroline-5-carboxylate reductase [Candidatus Acidiferrales bacterium]|jgi:pyrroline-5-carboxylate reductase
MTQTKSKKAGTSSAPREVGKNARIAVIGAGKMGGILLQAFLKRGLFTREQACATVQHPEKAAALSKSLGISVFTDNVKAVRDADIVLLCVKPQVVRSALAQMRRALSPAKLVVSIAASVPTSYIEQYVPARVPVIRAMPNTPCLVGKGMTAVSGGSHATPDHLETARKLFEVVGRSVIVDGKHMDAITGLSASGPAYIYIILESLAEAGVKVGLPRDMATLLSAQTVLGAASMVLETGDHPALLKEAVTTPAGCTIDGILELEDGKLRVTLIKAVVKAAQRAKELLIQS